jgi:methyl-accepting chemotaxis protein
VIGALADGDLTKRMVGDYQGSFLKLKEDANRMAEQIGDIVGRISAATGSVRNAAGEIDSGASELSTRTEQQAASLEETAAAMEEMAATVKTNAENAVEANSLAEATRGQAERGREVVAETVQAMANIRESSTEIGDIVSTIEAIAFQTNLLALNAAVEAARAGDAGKGFAVVASEVRTLAQRSGEAAKTIKDLIGKSTDHVAAGDRLVGDTDTALAEILEGVRNLARTIEEIADASKEQTTGVEEVSSTVSQMDEMTQQNASMADKSAAAARSLTEQSETLVELVRFFTTRESAGAEAKPGADRDQQAWDGDAKAETAAARKPAPAPRAAQAASGTWGEF